MSDKELVLQEEYGYVSVDQLAAYRKHNVSPSDHDDLAEFYGETSHETITAAVERYSLKNGQFEVYELWQDWRH